MAADNRIARRNRVDGLVVPRQHRCRTHLNYPSHQHFTHCRESRSSNMSTRIAVFGTGYLGATHAACMAELGHEVLGVDVDAAKQEKLAAGEVPFSEPGLGEVLRRHIVRGWLKFTASYYEAAECPAVFFLGVGTPHTKEELAAKR